jgi:hypothetical protein
VIEPSQRGLWKLVAYQQIKSQRDNWLLQKELWEFAELLELSKPCASNDNFQEISMDGHWIIH